MPDCTPHLHEVPKENDEDSFVDLIYRALKFDCIYLLEFECFKSFGHDRLTRLSADEEAYIVLKCRARVARRARSLGYRPSGDN